MPGNETSQEPSETKSPKNFHQKHPSSFVDCAVSSTHASVTGILMLLLSTFVLPAFLMYLQYSSIQNSLIYLGAQSNMTPVDANYIYLLRNLMSRSGLCGRGAGAMMTRVGLHNHQTNAVV
jgi:hypothetical protein